MIRRLLKRESADLDKAIDAVYDKMVEVGPDSDEYVTYLEHLQKLEKLRNESHSRKPSADTMLVVGGNLIGILIIVGFEHAHVLTSKAFGFIMKNKT